MSKLRAELEAQGALQAAGTVVAQIDNDKIDAAEVNQIVLQTVRGRQVAKDALPDLQAQALEHVIATRLVAKFLDSQQVNASEAEIAAALQAVKNQLSSRKVSYFDYLSLLGMTEAAFRDDVAFKLRWQKYCQAAANDAELQKFFDAHRADFDGRELRVSHILFRPEQPADKAAVEALKKKAEQAKSDIEAGKINFADAAKKYSSGPSRHQGGDLGFIPRRGVMEEEFSKAAFALEKGQISKPVTSTFGVHLIQWTDVHPGAKTLQDARAEVQPAAIQALFQGIADKMRSASKVEYTGVIPHIDPGTKEVVQPEPKATADKKEPAKESAKEPAKEPSKEAKKNTGSK